MISIVIPCYNVEKYISETIESLLNQSYKEFELLLIDDNSADETYNIAHNFAVKDERITLIRLEKNKGAAYARNYGSSLAKGEYIIFLDSDDTFEPDFLLKMYKSAVSSNADLVVCSFLIDYGDRVVYSQFEPNYFENTLKWMSDLPVNPWTKLVRRDLLDRIGSPFMELSNFNDVLYSVKLFIHANKISYLNKDYLIHYRIRPGQISEKIKIDNIIQCLEEFIHTMKENVDSYKFECGLYKMLVTILGAINSHLLSGEGEELYYKVRETLKLNEILPQYVSKELSSIVSYYEQEEVDFTINQYIYTAIKQIESLLLNDTGKLIYLWGDGIRGRRLQEALLKRDIKLSGIYDRNSKGIKNPYGYRYVDKTEIEQNADIIVASNWEIKNKIINKGISCEVVNLADVF